MRPIKFRAWDKNIKRWVSGFHISDDGRVWEYVQYEGWMDRSGIIEIVLFTGLLDKNGIEIYAGDLLRWLRPVMIVNPAKPEGYPFEVRWDNKFTGFFPFCHPNREVNTFDVEVIGNINENPELLK